MIYGESDRMYETARVAVALACAGALLAGCASDMDPETAHSSLQDRQLSLPNCAPGAPERDLAISNDRLAKQVAQSTCDTLSDVLNSTDPQNPPEQIDTDEYSTITEEFNGNPMTERYDVIAGKSIFSQLTIEGADTFRAVFSRIAGTQHFSERVTISTSYELLSGGIIEPGVYSTQITPTSLARYRATATQILRFNDDIMDSADQLSSFFIDEENSATPSPTPSAKPKSNVKCKTISTIRRGKLITIPDCSHG